MAIVELSFASGEHSLSVRKFTVHESMSNLFSVALEARSPNEDVDLESIVGKPALFRIASGVAWAHLDTRVWTGIVSEMELIAWSPPGSRRTRSPSSRSSGSSRSAAITGSFRT